MEVVQYKCPNCGSNITFETTSKALGCGHCGGSFTVEQIEKDLPEDDNRFTQANILYACPSCGAEVLTDKNTSSSKCFYCRSPVILRGRLSGKYKPDRIIPFSIVQADARFKLLDYCRGRRFLPNGFLTDTNLDEITAIYIPYWVADCVVSGKVHAECIKEERNNKGILGEDYAEYQEWHVLREGEVRFEKIPHDASIKADDELMECIEPFNYDEAVNFKMSYLSGHLAEKYDVTKDEVYYRVKERAVTGARYIMKEQVTGYRRVKFTENEADFYILDNNWSLYLMPVWFLAYSHKGRIYKFAVNGQTGKFAGDLPVAWWKVGVFAGAVSAALTGLVSGIFLLGGLL
ncbi:MAG: hypothetical protein FWD34_10080 [Oscillospiraceae bacterium]|nr:hypothetical protein [Oscillospiraceae bacterium]